MELPDPENVDVLLIDSSGVPYTLKHKSKSYPDIMSAVNFKKQNTFSVQSNSTHKREDKTLKCTDCPKLFKWPSHLRHHMRSHTNERPYKCSLCQKSFKDPHKLNRHQQIHPQFKKDTVYKCRVCDKNFKYQSDLDKHKLIHTGEKPFKCPTCGAGFRRFDHLKRHNFIHTNDRPFKCGVCVKGFVEATELLKHERIHTGNRPYQCSLCEKSFYHLRSLKEHAAAKHGLAALETKAFYREDFHRRINADKETSKYSGEVSTKTGKNKLELENSECFSTENRPNEIVVCISDDESESDADIKAKSTGLSCSWTDVTSITRVTAGGWTLVPAPSQSNGLVNPQCKCIESHWLNCFSKTRKPISMLTDLSDWREHQRAELKGWPGRTLKAL